MHWGSERVVEPDGKASLAREDEKDEGGGVEEAFTTWRFMSSYKWGYK